MLKKIALTALILICCILCFLFFTPTSQTNTQASTISAENTESATNNAKNEVVSENTSQTSFQDLPKAENIVEEEEGSVYVAGQIVVSFKEPSITDGSLSEDAKQILSTCKTVRGYEESVKQITENQCVLEVSEGATVSQAVRELSSKDEIEFADADWMFSLVDTETGQESTAADLNATLTNDPYITNQWALSSSWQTVSQAWEQVKVNKTVAVATLDSGVQADHPDLKNNILYSGFIPLDGYGANDRNGHGTHVAGIIAAESNNNIGVSGVSYNAGIVSIRVFRQIDSEWTAYSSDIALGIQNVILLKDTYNIKVINMSLGMTGTSRSNPPTGSSTMQSAIKRAYDAGISVCVASGNESTDTSLVPCNFPAYFDYCIAVGSIDNTRKRSSFSNGDNSLDVVAPGRNILSTMRNSGYSTMDGTSMAAPFVSGVIAMCYAINKNLTPSEVYSALTTTATDLGTSGFDNLYGYGLVNPSKAVSYAKNSSAPTSHTVTVKTSGDASGALTLKDDAGKVYTSGSNVQYGKYLTLTWNQIINNDSDGTLKMITSITKNNKSIYSVANIDKSSWKSTNPYWRSVFGTNESYCTYDAVKSALSLGGTIEVGHIDSNTTLVVTYAKLQPIYRLYNQITSEHLFTTSKTEYDKFANLCSKKQDFWVPEGIDWFAYPSKSSNSNPVYRLYNAALGAMGKNSHYYTSDEKEAENLIKNYGWKRDTFSGSTACFYTGGSIGIYTCYNEALGSAHHYTSSKTEWEGLAKHGWNLEKDKNNNATGFLRGVVSSK